MKIFVNKDKCQGSGECIKVCPHAALSLSGGKAVVDASRCDLDGLCLPACPHDAISLEEND